MNASHDEIPPHLRDKTAPSCRAEGDPSKNLNSSDGMLPDDLQDLIDQSRVRVEFGAKSLMNLGSIARVEGASGVLLVTDPGIIAAGHVDRALNSLRAADVEVTLFDGVEENPTTKHVDAGVRAARGAKINFLIGLGGGSSMDCAKGINFLLSNGGKMQDYWGVGKARRPMLPMIAVPTTAGTGSEAQSFALIADPVTHLKMACGDPKAACRVAILDPDLIATVPRPVAATTGIDAIAHAIETAGCSRRNDISRRFSLEAWKRLDASFLAVYDHPDDAEARTSMLLGAHLAGAAIEKSMLGAAHSCANPLTAKYGIVHGLAIGVMLPHVIRFNAADGDNPYADLCDDAEELARRVESMREDAGLPRHLADCGVEVTTLKEMAVIAKQQWTAQFNPRPVGEVDFFNLYQCALSAKR